MKTSTAALIVIGGIVLVIGVASLALGYLPSTETDTTTIPSGPNWYVAFDFPIVGGGYLSGNFQELAGGNVNVYVFTDAQYRDYDAGAYSGALFTTSGSSGQLNVALPGSDMFHLVVEHAAGYQAFQQDVRVTRAITRIGPVPLGVGLVATAIGMALVGFGLHRRNREDRVARGMVPLAPANVVFYPPLPVSPPYRPPDPPQPPPDGPDGGTG